jgi:hypothetical protein
MRPWNRGRVRLADAVSSGAQGEPKMSTIGAISVARAKRAMMHRHHRPLGQGLSTVITL